MTSSAVSLAIKRLSEPRLKEINDSFAVSNMGTRLLKQATAFIARSAKDDLAGIHMKQRLTHLADGRVLSLVVEQDRGVIFNVRMADNLQILNVLKESLTLTSQALASWSTIRAEERTSDLQTWARKFMETVQSLDDVFSVRCFNLFKSDNLLCNGV